MTTIPAFDRSVPVLSSVDGVGKHSGAALPERGADGPDSLVLSRRLLVMMPSWVGDCVMATPTLRAVRDLRAPSGHDTFMAAYMPPHLVPLLEATGLFEACIGGRSKTLAGSVSEASRLRDYGFDTALLLPNSFRSAWMMHLARIPRRIGYDRYKRGWLLTDRIPRPTPGGWDEPIPLVDYYLKLAEAVGVDRPGDVAPRLAVAGEEVGLARNRLASRGIDFARPLALLNPGANKPGKRWPPDRFAALADHLHDEHGMQIVINGAPAERELTQQVAARTERAGPIDLAREEASLAMVAAVCSLADLVVTNDTGTRHIAAAVGFERLRRGEPAPGVVTIFGTVQPEWTTLNYEHEVELFDRAGSRIEAVTLQQAIEACRHLIGKTR